MDAPIRVVLVEDNEVFRQGLELVFELRSDIEVVGAVDDGEAAAELATRLEPDVVLMDYRLPGMDGVQATAAVRAASPRTAVVCLTASASMRERGALFEAGAIECLTKDEELEEIVAAVHRAGRAARVE